MWMEGRPGEHKQTLALNILVSMCTQLRAAEVGDTFSYNHTLPVAKTTASWEQNVPRQSQKFLAPGKVHVVLGAIHCSLHEWSKNDRGRLEKKEIIREVSLPWWSASWLAQITKRRTSPVQVLLCKLHVCPPLCLPVQLPSRTAKEFVKSCQALLNEIWQGNCLESAT